MTLNRLLVVVVVALAYVPIWKLMRIRSAAGRQKKETGR